MIFVKLKNNFLIFKIILDNFETMENRPSDKAERFKDMNGNIFALEKDHWDILFPWTLRL